jgi:hypothetical protein
VARRRGVTATGLPTSNVDFLRIGVSGQSADGALVDLPDGLRGLSRFRKDGMIVEFRVASTFWPMLLRELPRPLGFMKT